MKKTLIFQIVMIAAMICSAGADEINTIELIDGSVILGEIVSVAGGVYTIRSETMGSVMIEKSKIRSIRFHSQESKKEVGDTSRTGTEQSEIQGFQQTLIADEDIFNIILSLQNDPKIQEILNDPELMKSVQSGDIQRLISNPKFMELLNHPKIKAINEKMAN